MLLVTAYWRTNLTLRQLASLFGISKSAADRIVDHVGPLLAFKQRQRFRAGTILIVDGTLVPTRDHSVAEQSKNYRYSTSHQVVIDADTRMVVVVGRPGPGNRNELTGPLEALLLLPAPGARSIEIGYLVGGPGGTAGSRCLWRLREGRGEAGRSAKRLRQSSLGHLFGGLRVGERRMQGVLDFLSYIVADALPDLGRELAGLPGQSEGQLVLLRRQLRKPPAGAGG
ncbi:hypothetical protein MBT84_39970 [Streptomyces sp. MBT84]|nr:hypothetical protein [Streptomyces sp. MBT84]